MWGSAAPYLCNAVCRLAKYSMLGPLGPTLVTIWTPTPPVRPHTATGNNNDDTTENAHGPPCPGTTLGRCNTGSERLQRARGGCEKHATRHNNSVSCTHRWRPCEHHGFSDHPIIGAPHSHLCGGVAGFFPVPQVLKHLLLLCRCNAVHYPKRLVVVLDRVSRFVRRPLVPEAGRQQRHHAAGRVRRPPVVWRRLPKPPVPTA